MGATVGPNCATLAHADDVDGLAAGGARESRKASARDIGTAHTVSRTLWCSRTFRRFGTSLAHPTVIAVARAANAQTIRRTFGAVGEGACWDRTFWTRPLNVAPALSANADSVSRTFRSSKTRLDGAVRPLPGSVAGAVTELGVALSVKRTFAIGVAKALEAFAVGTPMALVADALSFNATSETAAF